MEAEEEEGATRRSFSRRSFSTACGLLLFLFSSPARGASRRISEGRRGGQKRCNQARGSARERGKKNERRRHSLRFHFLLTDNRDDPPEVHLLLLLLERDAAAHGAAGPCGRGGRGGGRGAAQGRGGRASEGLHLLGGLGKRRRRKARAAAALLLSLLLLGRVRRDSASRGRTRSGSLVLRRRTERRRKDG